jgi:hypothetical protein
VVGFTIGSRGKVSGKNCEKRRGNNNIGRCSNTIRPECSTEGKKLKPKNLSIEIQRMWNMKCFVISVITGATEIVTKGLKNIWKQYQESIQ